MSNQAGQRQQQSQGPQLPGPNRLLSDEALQYVNLAAELRQQAVDDRSLLQRVRYGGTWAAGRCE